MSLFFLQLRGEFWKLFARKRTYIGFGAYLLIEALIVFLLHLPKMKAGLQHLIETQGYAFQEYSSGLTLAFMIIAWTVFLLGPLYVSLVTGDLVAKEVEDGIMRMILSRPVSRLRVVALRYVAAFLYTGVLFFFIAVSALLFGLAKDGVGGMFVFAPTQKILALYEFGPGLQRYLLSIPLMALSFFTVTSLGFLFSCCNMKPASVVILCMSLYLIDMIFQGVPQFESIHEWFMTTHMFAWMHIYQPLVPVWDMVGDYAYLLGVDATLFTIGMLIFQGRDFKA